MVLQPPEPYHTPPNARFPTKPSNPNQLNPHRAAVDSGSQIRWFCGAAFFCIVALLVQAASSSPKISGHGSEDFRQAGLQGPPPGLGGGIREITKWCVSVVKVIIEIEVKVMVNVTFEVDVKVKVLK